MRIAGLIPFSSLRFRIKHDGLQEPKEINDITYVGENSRREIQYCTRSLQYIVNETNTLSSPVPIQLHLHNTGAPVFIRHVIGGNICKDYSMLFHPLLA